MGLRRCDVRALTLPSAGQTLPEAIAKLASHRHTTDQTHTIRVLPLPTKVPPLRCGSYLGRWVKREPETSCNFAQGWLTRCENASTRAAGKRVRAAQSMPHMPAITQALAV